MNCSAAFIEYGQTGYFSKLVTDYIAADEKLQPFQQHPVSVEGIKAAIEQRKQFNTDRKLLTTVLTEQYKNISLTAKQQFNLEQLGRHNSFTITTAHQPNIFTGYLYFIYKILHVIKLAEQLQTELPGNHFLPVYYMGSEDADLEELGHVFIGGEKLEWKTSQTGAVGRMKVDKALLQLLEGISGQLLVYPHGAEIIRLMKDCYKEGTTIENATFYLVNALFAEYGLLILLPDNSALKKAFIPVIEKELAEAFSHKAVAETVAQFPKEYKVQASGREINLFYLEEGMRERIVPENSIFKIQNSKLEFDDLSIKEELKRNPEKFSPNVILRPVFQTTILPDIAFIGGGGEIAYWLELKKVFEAVNVPYPVLVVRNSFMFISKEIQLVAEKLQLKETDLFKTETELLNVLVKRDSTVQLSLEKEKLQLQALYAQLKDVAGKVDITLQKHTAALLLSSLKKIEALEKKMLKAEKKKFEAQQRQLHKLKNQLFPYHSLQERIGNIMPFYAGWGNDFIKTIYQNSKGLEQQFAIITEK